MQHRTAALSLAALLALAGAGAPTIDTATGAIATHAGPPAICVPVECAGEKTLPWGSGVFETSKGYRAGDAVKDALIALESSGSVLTHMETLRRATIYLSEQAGPRDALLGALIAKAADAEADDLPDRERALAWFDAGYFAACLFHLGARLDWKPGAAEGVLGYEWLERAAEADTADPAIRFAMAIACHPGVRESKRDLWELHMAAAIRGSGRDALVRRNIDAHLAHWGERASDFAG